MVSPKKVQFPENEADMAVVICMIETRDEFTEEDIEALFFSKNDYQVSRAAAKLVSKESHRQGHGKHLDDTFSEKNEEAQDKLNTWAAKGHHRRGLERWVNREHGEKRQQDQFAAVQAVLEAQEEMLARGKQTDDEKLRKVSHKATKTSRHFARMMGKADSFALAHAMKGLDDSSLSDSISLANSTSSMESSGSFQSFGSVGSIQSCTSEDDFSLPRVDENDHPHPKEKGMFSRLKFRRSKVPKGASSHTLTREDRR